MKTLEFPTGTTLLGVNFVNGKWVVTYKGPESLLELDDNGLLTLGDIRYRFSGKQLALLEMIVPVGTTVDTADAILDIYSPDDDSDDDRMNPMYNLIYKLNKRLDEKGFPYRVSISRGESSVIALVSE